MEVVKIGTSAGLDIAGQPNVQPWVLVTSLADKLCLLSLEIAGVDLPENPDILHIDSSKRK